MVIVLRVFCQTCIGEFLKCIDYTEKNSSKEGIQLVILSLLSCTHTSAIY